MVKKLSKIVKKIINFFYQKWVAVPVKSPEAVAIAEVEVAAEVKSEAESEGHPNLPNHPLGAEVRKAQN